MKQMARLLDKQTSRTIIVFFAVSLLWTAGAAVRAFLLPKSYVGTARIDLSTATDSDSVNKEIKVIMSPRVLTNVITTLQLKERWAHQYFNDEPLKLGEVLTILNQRVVLSQTRNTSIISIGSYSDDPGEAADIANAFADSYRDFKLETLESDASEKMTWPAPKILEQARTPLRPCKPVILVSVICGFLVSIPVGTVAAGFTALWFVFGRKFFTNSKAPAKRSDPCQPVIKQRY